MSANTWRAKAASATLFLAVSFCGLPQLYIDGQAASSRTRLTLHEAILQSQTSPEAHTGQDRVEAANGQVMQAGLHPNPRLYLQSEDLRPWANDFSFANATEDYGYLGQVFELGGKRGNRLVAAHANMRQTEAERALLMQQIAGRVASAYWTSVMSTAIVHLLEEDRKAVDAIVQYNQSRVDAGAMRGIDLIRAQIERDRLLLVLEAARRDALLAQSDLFRQMGRPVDRNVELSDTLDAASPIEAQPLTAILAARADVAVAREAVSVAEAEVRLQRSLGVPDLDLLGGYKRNSGNDTLYTSLQIPLPFRNRNQGEVARAQANVHLAQDHLQQLQLNIQTDVAAAQESYMQQQRVIRDILPDMRARAKQNLAIMDDAYRTGGVDLLRYLDAERTAFDVEVSALRTLADFQQAALRLQLVYGRQP